MLWTVEFVDKFDLLNHFEMALLLKIIQSIYLVLRDSDSYLLK